MSTRDSIVEYRAARSALAIHARALMHGLGTDTEIQENVYGKSGETGAHVSASLIVRSPLSAELAGRLGEIALDVGGTFDTGVPYGTPPHVHVPGPIGADGEDPPGPPPYRLSPALSRSDVTDTAASLFEQAIFDGGGSTMGGLVARYADQLANALAEDR